MKTSKLLMAISLGTLVLILTQVAYADIVWWNKDYPAAPDRGEFLWNDGSQVVWGPSILQWEQSSINALKGLPWWALPTIELEGYNPADGSSCDRLYASWCYADFPNRGWDGINGCGPWYSREEQFDIHMDESSNNWWAGYSYQALGWWDKGSLINVLGEVNFTYEQYLSDDWLGKVGYYVFSDLTFFPYCSTPAYSLPSKDACP
jgi:hypothetical protein